MRFCLQQSSEIHKPSSEIICSKRARCTPHISEVFATLSASRFKLKRTAIKENPLTCWRGDLVLRFSLSRRGYEEYGFYFLMTFLPFWMYTPFVGASVRRRPCRSKRAPAVSVLADKLLMASRFLLSPEGSISV